MSLSVLLTVPHSLCIDDKNRSHTCDSSAKASAITLSHALEKIQISNLVILADENRTVHDLNRKNSRKTPFRQIISKILQQHPLLLLDIHSFPNEYLVEAGTNNLFKKGETPPDIVLLTGKKDRINDKSISEVLEENLKKYYLVKIVHDINVVDIIANGAEEKVPGILIEINEKISLSHRSILNMMQHIAKCVKILIS